MADCGTCGGPLDPGSGKCPACIALGHGEGGDAAVAENKADGVVGLPLDGNAGAAAAEPPAPRAEEPVAAAKPPPPPEPEPEPEKGTDAAFIRDMREVMGDGRTAVVLIGLSGAGKSWLLHRFLHEVSLYEDSDPKFVSVSEESTEGEDLEPTSTFDFYTIYSNPHYTLIDTPGEKTRLLTDGSISELWELTAALKQAGSIIVAIPCDVAVIGPLLATRVDVAELYNLKRYPLDESIAPEAVNTWIQEARKEYRKLEDFTSGLIHAAAAVSYVRHHGVDCLDKDQFARRVTKQNVMKHRTTASEFLPIGGKNGLSCPSFFALTKSDRLVAALHGDGESSGFDPLLTERLGDMWDLPDTRIMAALLEYRDLADSGDLRLERPADLMQKVNPRLHHRLLTYFPMGRFDFVSAFFGHLGGTKLKFGHYQDHPEQGVNEMREWIQEARKIAGRGEKRFSRYAAARQLHFFLHGIPLGKSSI